MNHDPDRLNWGELVLEGVDARRQRDGAQWKLGDLALEVETTYGGHNLERFADEVGIEPNTLQDYRYVAAAYRLSERSDSLGWSHHRVLASRADRIAWVARTEQGLWSIRRLRQEIAEADSLAAQEHLIEERLGTAVRTALALITIRDEHKYRAAGYRSFDEYCRKRWGISADHPLLNVPIPIGN